MNAEPRFLNPGVSIEPVQSRFDGTLLLLLAASAAVLGLAIVGGVDVFHRVLAWV